MCVHVCMYERKNDKNLNFSWLFKEKKKYMVKTTVRVTIHKKWIRKQKQ